MATNKLSSSTSETGRNYIVTENNPWFGSAYTSYDTNEGGGCHFRKYPDGTFKMFNGRTGDYETVNDPELIDYLKNRSSVLELNSKNERVNLLGWMMPNRLLNTKFGNYIGHLENGGTMNYALYLQEGGNAPQENSLLSDIVNAFKENPEAIISQILESLGITDPDQAKQAIPAIIQQFAEIAELTLDSELGEIVSELASEIGLLKCGGRVRAKVKKACGGKRLKKGAKIPVEKKGGCPCQYRRVGGRIQLVDCNGIPVAKNGDVLKMQRGNQLSPTQASDAVRNYMTAKPYSVGEVMDAIGNTIPAYRLWNKYYPSFVNRMNQWQDSILGTPTTVKKVTTVETTQPSVGSEAWKTQQRANLEKYYETPEGRAAIEKVNSASIQQTPAAPTRVYARTPDQVKAWNNARLNSDTIKYIQRALNIMGYNSGEPTGVMDLKTIDAIRTFQESNGLKVDGLFGAKTRAVFEEKVAEGQYSQSNFGQPKVNNDGVLEVGRKPLTMDEWELAELKKKQPLVAALTSNAQPITVAPISTDRVLAKLPTKIAISKQGAKMSYADYLK